MDTIDTKQYYVQYKYTRGTYYMYLPSTIHYLVNIHHDVHLSIVLYIVYTY